MCQSEWEDAGDDPDRGREAGLPDWRRTVDVGLAVQPARNEHGELAKVIRLARTTTGRQLVGGKPRCYFLGAETAFDFFEGRGWSTATAAIPARFEG
jgi:hypothetical protein